MNPLKRLIEEVVRPQTTRGRVVRVSEGKLVIKSASGAILATSDPLQHYVVGDSVVVANGAVVGKDRDLSSLPKFYV